MFKIIKNADAAYDFEKTFIKFERMKYTRCGFTSADQKTGSLWTDTIYTVAMKDKIIFLRIL